jgi:hypothetical protein
MMTKTAANPFDDGHSDACLYCGVTISPDSPSVEVGEALAHRECHEAARIQEAEDITCRGMASHAHHQEDEEVTLHSRLDSSPPNDTEEA